MSKIILSGRTTCGGAGIVASDLAIELAMRGWEVHYVAFGKPYRIVLPFKNIFLHVVEEVKYPLFSSSPHTLAFANKIAEVARKHRIKLVHVHYAVPAAVSAYLAKQLLGRDLKIITTPHGTDANLIGADPAIKMTTKFGLIQSDHLTVATKFLKRELVKNFNMSSELKDKVTIIKNFIDADIFERTTGQINYGDLPETEEKVLVHVSNFRPFKRAKDVIRVAAKVLKKHRIKLWMVGDGPDRLDAERLAEELNILEHVVFWGKRSDILKILQRAHIFIFPTSNDNFSLATTEAMYCGLPIISTTCGGMPEVVKHNHSGFLSELGDTTDMANNVIKLLDDEELYRTFSANAERQCKENCDPKVIIPQYEEIYNRFLAE
jgi:L-malate glycosyltransferase